VLINLFIRPFSLFIQYFYIIVKLLLEPSWSLLQQNIYVLSYLWGYAEPNGTLPLLKILTFGIGLK